MKKFLIGFAVVAVAIVILAAVGGVFSQTSNIEAVYNTGANWVADSFDMDTAPTVSGLTDK